jgi:predicted permease
MNMPRWRSTLQRIRRVVRHDDVQDRLDDEVRFHIDMQTQRNVERGLEPVEARRLALLEFGGRERYQEAARDEFRSRPLEELVRDLRSSVRTIRRQPGFALATTLTMAIGIAATASIFSVADAFLFRPLPFKDADRIVVLGDVQDSDTWLPASYLEFKDWRDMSRDASAVVATVNGGMSYVGTDRAERLRVGRVSEGYFEMFGLRPLIGRVLSRTDHAEGASRVAIASRAFWRQKFGEQPAILGQQVTLNRQSYTVVGVVESGLELGAEPTQLWIPLEPEAPWRDRGSHYLTVFARIRDGATLASLQRDLDGLAKRVRDANQTTHGIVAEGLRERIVGPGRKPLYMLLGSVGLLLLISIANVAGLLQARTASRATELAVRTALGAGRWRLVRQIVTESVVLAVLGGALGVLLGVWVIKGFVWLWPTNVPRPVDIGIDLRVTLFALGLSVLGAFVAAVLTAVVRRGVVSLNDRASGGFGISQRIRRTLVAFEVAITVVLLVGAGLTMRSLERIMATNTGLATSQVLTARLVIGREGPQQRAFFGELLDRIRALPGVDEAGAITNLPLTGGGMSGDFVIEGRPPFPRGEAPSAEKSIVTPGFFSTMQIPLLRGRGIETRDVAGATEVAVINETMAKRFWPNADPIGQRIRMMGDSTHWQMIVGVVGDTKLYSLEEPPGLNVYVPFEQWPAGGLGLAIRTTTPSAVAAALPGIVRSMDPMLPLLAVQPYEKIIYQVTHTRRVPAVLLGAFAALALLLAAVGLYGLLAYAVQQRRHEMGVRMAVGAQRGAVLRLVMGEGLRLVAAGTVLGVLSALGLARTIASLLYGVEPHDPMVFGLAALAITAVACVACALPAHRASRVDPATVLRSD